MRIALALVLFAGCIQPAPDPGPGPSPDPGWGTGTGGTGGNTGSWCHADSECGGSYVCARDGECLSTSQVHTIHVTWTVHDEAASTMTCAAAPNLDITFINNLEDANDQFGFSPVPCVEGKFTVDKMPIRYGAARLAPAGSDFGAAVASFDSAGTVALNLTF